MPLPFIVWGLGAAAAAIGAAIVMDDSDDDSERQREGLERVKKEAEAKAEEQRQTSKFNAARAYSREKLKAFINSYELSYPQNVSVLNDLIGQIAENGNLNRKMGDYFRNTPAICDFDKNIAKEKARQSSMNDAETYLKMLGGNND